MMRHRTRAIAASAAVVAAIAIGGCKGTSSSASSAPPVSASAAASPSLAHGSGQASVPGAELTASQQQAVTAAQGYLSDGQGFSYKGLLGQLTSSYGDQFSQADAKFAIGYLHPDWDAQAVTAAKGYLADGQGFSRASLISQLDSTYGDQFTYDQAVYAADHVGL